MNLLKNLSSLTVTRLFAAMLLLVAFGAATALSACGPPDESPRAKVLKELDACRADVQRAKAELKKYRGLEHQDQGIADDAPCTLQRLTELEPELKERLHSSRQAESSAKSRVEALRELVQAPVAVGRLPENMPELPVTSVQGNYNFERYTAEANHHGICTLIGRTRRAEFTGRTAGSWDQLVSFAKAWFDFTSKEDKDLDVSFNELGIALETGLISHYGAFISSAGTRSQASDLTLFLVDILNGDPASIVALGQWSVATVEGLPGPMQGWVSQMLMQAWNLLSRESWQEVARQKERERDSEWHGRIARRYLAAEQREAGGGEILINTYRFWIAQMAAALKYFPAKKWMADISPEQRDPLSRAHAVYKKAFAAM